MADTPDDTVNALRDRIEEAATLFTSVATDSPLHIELETVAGQRVAVRFSPAETVAALPKRPT